MVYSVELIDLCFNNLFYSKVYNNIVALLEVLIIPETSNVKMAIGL